MKVTYKNCEIECHRDETVDCDDILSYSIIDKNDGFEVCSGITWYHDYTVKEYIDGFLKDEVDNYIAHPEEYRDIENDANEEDTDKDEETYRITPKGIALFSMLQCGLINSIEDPRAEGFWILFETGMKKHEYI